MLASAVPALENASRRWLAGALEHRRRGRVADADRDDDDENLRDQDALDERGPTHARISGSASRTSDAASGTTLTQRQPRALR